MSPTWRSAAARQGRRRRATANRRDPSAISWLKPAGRGRDASAVRRDLGAAGILHRPEPGRSSLSLCPRRIRASRHDPRQPGRGPRVSPGRDPARLRISMAIGTWSGEYVFRASRWPEAGADFGDHEILRLGALAVGSGAASHPRRRGRPRHSALPVASARNAAGDRPRTNPRRSATSILGTLGRRSCADRWGADALACDTRPAGATAGRLRVRSGGDSGGWRTACRRGVLRSWSPAANAEAGGAATPLAAANPVDSAATAPWRPIPDAGRVAGEM